MRPNSYGSSTIGAKKSTVWTSARSSRSTKTPASSKVSRPTRTRRSACVGTPLSASARSPGPSLAAQPAQRAKLVRRKSSARDLFVDIVWVNESGLRRGGKRRDQIDLDEHAARQAGDLHGGSRGACISHRPGVDLVHAREVAHVGEKD